MNVKDLWRSYEEYTRDVTVQSRKLGFAAAAICWFFKTEDFTFPPFILVSLLFVVCFFVLDLLQYVLAAKRVRDLARSEEEKAWKEKRSVEVEVDVPAELDRPAKRLFNAKVVLLFLSFGMLAAEFVRRLV